MILNNTNSSISVCSNALLLLAHPAISSFDEIGAGPALCKNLYPNTYRSFLSLSNWNWATKTATLTMLNETPISKEFKYVYLLPVDTVRVTTCYPITNYSIEGTRIYTYSKIDNIEYQGYVEEENIPPVAIEALQYLLASKLAYPLTNDPKKTELYTNLAQKSLQQARFTDSQNDVNQGYIDYTLTNVRN